MQVQITKDYMDEVHYSVKDASEYVWFHNQSKYNKPKTEVWDVLTKGSNYLLGEIKYYARWRQYCFFPKDKPVFSVGCMQDIINFTKELTKNKNLTDEMKRDDQS